MARSLVRGVVAVVLLSEEAIRQAEWRCHEAVRGFQAALTRLAEAQPLELAEAIAEAVHREVEELQDSQEE